jgi:hypothetical protein
MPAISRRKVISVGMAAGLSAIFPTDIIAGISPLGLRRRNWLSLERIGGPSLAGEFLDLRSASDSIGLAMLDRTFPGLTSDVTFQRFLPTAFLVTNVSQNDIRAFTTIWLITTPAGEHEVTVAYCNVGGALWYSAKGSRKRFLVTGRIPVIKAGHTRLITPFFSLVPKAYGENERPNWGMLALQRPESVLLDLKAESSNVTTRINAAITENYVALGPDAASLGRFFCITRNAEHDEAVSVRRQIAAGASREQVLSYLRQQVSRAGLDVPESALYYNVRQRQARIFIRRLRRRGWNQFLGTVHFLTNQPKTVIAL